MFDRYKLEKDDTLNIVAKKFGTTESYLKDINDIYFLDDIREGQDIIVPINNEIYYDVYIVKNGMSVKEISKLYNVNPDLFESLNGLDKDDYIYSGQEVLIPKKNYSYYIAKDGDTIKTVANIFNVSKERLLSQNSTLYLLAGQIIVNKKLN